MTDSQKVAMMAVENAAKVTNSFSPRPDQGIERVEDANGTVWQVYTESHWSCGWYVVSIERM